MRKQISFLNKKQELETVQESNDVQNDQDAQNEIELILYPECVLED